MKNRIIASAVAFALTAGAPVALTAPAYAQNAKQLGTGAAIGGVGGAIGGAVIPGLSTIEGAALGAGAGLAVTALTKNKKRYCTNSRGRQYRCDKNGRYVR